MGLVPTRGARSAKLRSRRCVHRSPGSITCESAEITRNVAISLSSVRCFMCGQSRISYSRRRGCARTSQLHFVEFAALNVIDETADGDFLRDPVMRPDPSNLAADVRFQVIEGMEMAGRHDRD